MKNSERVLYFEEHLSCSNYIKENDVVFVKQRLKKEEKVSLHLNKEFAVLFLLNGRIIIDLPNHQKIKTVSKEIVLLSNYYDYNLTVKSDTDLTILYFDRPASRCDLLAFDKMQRTNVVDKEGLAVRKLKMNGPVLNFIKNMDFYLDHKMYCRHLHDIKESEFFFIVRAFYTKEEIAYFFNPVIQSLNKFTNLVKANYMKAETVKDLAKICHMTTKTFTRKFKKVFNTTPKQWMMEEKMKYNGTTKAKAKNRNVKKIVGVFRQ